MKSARISRLSDRPNVGNGQRSKHEREKSPPEEGRDPGCEQDEEEEKMLHKPNCPRSKSRSKAMRESGPGSEGMHPRPWGARDPANIPCCCFVKNEVPRGRSKLNFIKNAAEASLKKNAAKAPVRATKRSQQIIDFCEDCVTRLGRRFGNVTKEEYHTILEKLAATVQVASTPKSKKNSARADSAALAKRQKPATANGALVHSKDQEKGLELIPSRPNSKKARHLGVTGLPASRESNPSFRTYEHHDTKSPVTSKVEKNQILIEVSTEGIGKYPPSEAEIRSILGNLNSSILNSGYDGDSSRGGQGRVDSDGLYAEVPANYNRYALLGLEKDNYGGGHKQQTNGLRVQHDVNEHNYTICVNDQQQKFIKRQSNTKAEMYLKVNKPEPKHEGITKIIYLQSPVLEVASKTRSKQLEKSKRY